MASIPQQFVHLHLHSAYSLLDGGNRIAQLVKRVKELGMDSVAVTDHGNLFGAVDFYLKARDAGVKPILGIEAYVAPGDRKSREYTGVQDGGHHLVLLAENLTGWKNLVKLSSDSYLHGFYFKPRMDKTTLAQWSEGIIAINGHLGSSLAALLTRYVQNHDESHYRAALEEARWHAKTFGPNEKGEPRFYIELQRHDTPDQEAINGPLVRLAQELNLPIICDNDAHFLTQDDHDAHDTLCCISMGKIKTEPNRLKYSPQLYVKSPQQMVELFHDHPQALENTVRVAQRCNVELNLKQSHAPEVKIDFKPGKLAGPVGSTPWFQAFCAQYELLPFDAAQDADRRPQIKQQCDDALRALAQAGALWRYGEQGVTDEHRARLDRELKVLADKNISAYFLIVWDFVNEARRRGIPANARGSGVGTMVGYCLGLSNACPVQYGLLFERFTDPDRSEYPDIDIDICQDGRQQIIDYVRQKYGHVAQIITFGTLKARAAIRDVGRVLNIPLPDVDKVCKLVGDALGTTIDKALNQEPDLKKLYDDNPLYRELIDTARRLEGLARHAGVHAAGVVIATQPLDNIVPLYQPANTNQVVTQWDGPTVEKVGLLKMDFLGLRTLSIIERARQLIRATLKPATIFAAVGASAPASSAKKSNGSATPGMDPLDLDRLTYNDPKVLELFARGETAGVFQFESGGMRNLLVAMKPDRLEDLIAANALFRPGPMDLIPDYCDRKHHRKPVPTAHPIVDQYTRDTYGIMVYQEQVMQIVHGLGGIPLRAAYTLIKNISKKKQKDIDAMRPVFVQGSQKQGLSGPQAEDLFNLILKFAGYGFNKSHSSGYAIIAYQTAYLKTYFPLQYMAALLTYESVSIDKVTEYVDECRRVLLPDGRRGIDVRAPDINLSEVGFTVVFDPGEPEDASHGHIRFGLSAVKGVGDKAIAAIIQARQKSGRFKSLHDFCERVPLGSVNRATIEALIKCGAFDSLHGADRRSALAAVLESAIAAGHRAAEDRESGQLSMFGSAAEAAPDATAAASKQEVRLPSTPPWTPAEQLKHEKDVLGFYISSHPLDQHRQALEQFSSATVADVDRLAANVEVVLGGILTRVRPTVTKTGKNPGQKMAMITIEDSTGPLEAVVFSEAYALTAPLLENDRVVLIKGKVDRRRERPSVIVQEVIPIEQAPAVMTQTVQIDLREPAADARDEASHPLSPDDLLRLKELLRQATVAANGYSSGNGKHRAQVVLRVHQADQVVELRLNQVRIPVDADLPQRIATVLRQSQTSNCCRLLGPAKLLRSSHAAQVLHAQDAAPADRLERSTDSQEFCESIDRY